MKPTTSNLPILVKALWLTVLVSMLHPTIALCSTPPTSCDLPGTRITLLSRVYDQAQDKTRFVYRIAPTSLLGALKTARIVFPDCPTFKALVSANPASGGILQSTLLPDLNAYELGRLNLLRTSQDVELTLLGRVDLGVVNVEAEPLLGGRRSAQIAGPRLAPEAALDLNIDPDTCLNLALPEIPILSHPAPAPTAGPNPTPGHTPAPRSSISGVLCNIANRASGIVGSTLRIPVEVLNDGLRPMKVECDQSPLNAILPLSINNLLMSGDRFTVEWTPVEADRSSSQLLRLRVSEDEISATICETEISVLDDDIPPTAIVEPVQNPATCGGTYTSVRLSASRSYDPEGRKLAFAWSTDCELGTIDAPSAADTVLRLTKPGLGVPQACFAYLSVSDGLHTVNHAVSVSALACDTSCPVAQRDICGVCNGQNACLDCAGAPHGPLVVDRCGVCGGSNTCVDCAGVAHGGAVRDACNICGGDGTSCRLCTKQDLRSLLLSLDGAVLKVSKTIGNGLKPLRSTPGRNPALRLQKKASTIYNSAWKLIWSLSDQNLNCSSYAGCTSISSTASFSTLKAHNEQLKRITRHAASLLARHAGPTGKRRARKLKKAVEAEQLGIEELKAQYPSQVVSCG